MPTWRDIRETADFRELDNVRELTGYAIQSQYSASEKILALCAAFQERLDPSVDIDLFYSSMVSIYSATGLGLDQWGIILGMGRTIDDAESGKLLTLDDDYYRALLLYKAMSNISASTAAAQNALLSMLVETGIAAFPRVAYVLEVESMVIRWVFEDSLNAMQLAVFRAAGTLARGAGVGWELYALDPAASFGFDGSSLQPFNQAPFAADAALLSQRG